MVNARKKGRNAEKAFAKMMEDAGWFVILTPPPKKYNQFNDYFHLYDAICFKGKYRKYVQIKCNQKPYGKVKQQFVDWGLEYANEYDSVEWWNKKDREGWFSYILFPVE